MCFEQYNRLTCALYQVFENALNVLNSENVSITFAKCHDTGRPVP
jgi:hypothetical protein